MEPFVSATCEGERCHCGKPAAKKVGEEIPFDDPAPARHSLTAYVCADHYAELMGPVGAKQVGASIPTPEAVQDTGAIPGSRASTEPVSRLGPSGFDPERSETQDEWLARISTEQDRLRLVWLASAVLACDYGDNETGRGIGWWIRSDRDDAPLMIGPSINAAIDNAIAMEARQGGDGETRLHPKDDSAGRKASPSPNPSSSEQDALREALEPFARAADVRLCGEWGDDEHFGQTDVAFYLTFGDLRRARAALTASPKGQDHE